MKIDRNLLILHITVFVWGFTGILGNLISISAIQLTWYRVLIAFLSLFIYFQAKGISIKVDRKRLIQFLITGGVVGLHWVLFFESIKLSTVSVTLVCLSAVTLFTSFLEPLFYKRRISKLEVIIGLLVITGIYLIFKFESQYVEGIIVGLIAAFIGSFFSILNSKLVQKTEGNIISFYEMFGAWLWISVFMLFTEGFDADLKLKMDDLLYLLLLGTVCTAGAYVAAVNIMRSISPFRVALAGNLEPIYGIILAWIIFGQKEVMSGGFYFGAILILFAVFTYPILKLKFAKR